MVSYTRTFLHAHGRIHADLTKELKEPCMHRLWRFMYNSDVLWNKHIRANHAPQASLICTMKQAHTSKSRLSSSAWWQIKFNCRTHMHIIRFLYIHVHYMRIDTRISLVFLQIYNLRHPTHRSIRILYVCLQGSKSWPLFGQDLPALSHELKRCLGTAWGPFRSLASHDFLSSLGIGCDGWKRNHATGPHFPQKHAEGIHVGFLRISAVFDWFGCHPPAEEHKVNRKEHVMQAFWSVCLNSHRCDKWRWDQRVPLWLLSMCLWESTGFCVGTVPVNSHLALWNITESCNETAE